MIQYVPAEHAPVEAGNANFVLCIWVHGYRKGRGNFQGLFIGGKEMRTGPPPSYERIEKVLRRRRLRRLG